MKFLCLVLFVCLLAVFCEVNAAPADLVPQRPSFRSVPWTCTLSSCRQSCWWKGYATGACGGADNRYCICSN